MTPSQIPAEISKIVLPKFSPAHLPPEISQIGITVPFSIDEVMLFLVAVGLIWLLLGTVFSDRRFEARLHERQVLNEWRLKRHRAEKKRLERERTNCFESGLCARCENVFGRYQLKFVNYGDGTDLFCKGCRQTVEEYWRE